MKSLELITLLGTIISVLLSIIAYFLKQLHGNIRKMEQDVALMKASMQLIKSETKANYNLLRQRMEFLENGFRPEALCQICFKSYVLSST